MANIHSREEHEYRGWNDALNCFVEGKAHYRKLMEAGGFVTFEKAQEIAERARGKKENNGDDKELHRFLEQVKLTADSKGRIQITNKLAARMKDFGVTYDQFIPEELKRDKPLVGGMV